MSEKKRSERNQTLTLDVQEKDFFLNRVITPEKTLAPGEITDKTLCGDFFDVVEFLPEQFIDLLIIDPPYNLNRKFGSSKFRRISIENYTTWFEQIIVALKPLLKPNATVYVCAEWRSSTSIHLVLEKYFTVLNRISWEREKGRGSLYNWKNNSEDIWFAVNSKNDYTFNVEDVKLNRQVIAPYRKEDGTPKDWNAGKEGNFRATYPSNIWNDITVPFWSMPENTDHPTQKPEKLLAKLILASSNEGDFVFDPFLGSGTTSVTAKKLKRHYCGIEIDPDFCAIAEKRLELANNNEKIQGYDGSIFWERNTFAKINEQKC